jgi:hypothetical protein
MFRRILIALIGTLCVLIVAAAVAATSAPAEQYMAVCIETQEHGGQEYALTAWLASREAANEAGKAHEQATRGHRWTIRTRNAPEAESSLAHFGVAAAAAPVAASTADCTGNACKDVNVKWNGRGYDVSNGGGQRVLVRIRFAFGLSCMGPADIDLAPNESKTYLNGGYCNPYEASYE